MAATTRRSKLPELDDATLDDAIVSLVARFPEGLPLTKVRTTLPPPYRVDAKRIQARVAALAEGEKIHRWSATTIGPFAIDRYAAEALAKALEGEPRTLKEIERALPAAAKKALAKGLLKKRVEEKVAARALFLHPDPERSTGPARYSTSRAEAADYLGPLEKVLEKELEKLAKKLAPAGVDRAALVAALAAKLAAPVPREEHVDRRTFFDAVRTVRPDADLHVLVSIPQVRARLSWSKSPFDHLVLDLAREGRITLHEHDHPAGLEPDERATLVADELGRHYIGLVLEDAP